MKVKKAELLDVMSLLSENLISKTSWSNRVKGSPLRLEGLDSEVSAGYGMRLRRGGLAVDLVSEHDGAQFESRDLMGLTQAMVKKLGKDVRDLTLLVDNEEEVGLRHGNRTVSVKNASVENNCVRYEPLPELEYERFMMAMQVGDLTAMLDRIYPFMSVDEARPVLNGVLLRLKEPTVLAVATDSHRLIKHEIPGELGSADYAGVQEMILSRGDVSVLRNLLKKTDGDVFLYDTSTDDPTTRSSIALQGYGDEMRWTLHCLPVEGNFPEFERLMPDKDTMSIYAADRERLLEAAEVAVSHLSDRGLPDSKRLNLVIKEPVCRIYGHSGKGSFEDVVPGTSEELGEGKFSINGDFLADALRASKGRWVRFYLNTSPETLTENGSVMKPMFIGEDVLQMPMRPREE